MDTPGNYSNIIQTLMSIWQGHIRVRTLLSSAMRRDICPLLRRTLIRAQLTAIVFEHDIEDVYHSLKDHLKDTSTEQPGFDPGSIRRHGLTSDLLLDTILCQWNQQAGLYALLIKQVSKEGITSDWCKRHIEQIQEVASAIEAAEPQRVYSIDLVVPAAVPTKPFTPDRASSAKHLTLQYEVHE